MRAGIGWTGAIALALGLPVLLSGGALFLWLGPARSLGAAEIRAAEEAVAAARKAFGSALAGGRGFELRLGPGGRPEGPFLPLRAQHDAPLPQAGTLEEVGLALAARGRPEEALAVFEAARESLGGEGRLALARLLAAAGRTAEARAALVDGFESGDPPFSLLARLLDARIAAAAGDPGAAARLRSEIVAGQRRLAAASAAPVLELLDRLSPGEEPGRSAFLAGAAVFRALEAGRMAEPRAPARAAEGHLLAPLAPGRLEVVPSDAVERLCRESLEAAGRPGLALALGPPPEAALASGLLEPAGVPLHALPAGTRPSRRVEGAALLLLGLAAAALAAGALLGARTLRRELELARLRLEFVDLVSHELRTPLTGLALRAELLARGEVPAGKERGYLKALQTEVGRLTDLVNRILDFARLQRNRMPLERRALDAREVVARGVRAGREALKQAGQRLAIDVPRGLPRLEADPEVLARALRNLLENAARYAPRGSETALSARPDGACLEISVADRGPGVPADERHAVFEAFYRGRNRTPSGSGLGLAIVAQAARAHGGSVAVADRPGGGAVFSLRLPLAHGGLNAQAPDRRG